MGVGDKNKIEKGLSIPELKADKDMLGLTLNESLGKKGDDFLVE